MSIDRFLPVLADDPEGQRIHFSLRYRVFCEETGFEAPAEAGEEERDEFDQRSVHFLLSDRSSGEWVAASRLVLRGDGPLPVERFCRALHEEEFRAPRTPDSEVSRLLVIGRHRGARATYAILRSLLGGMACYGLQAGLSRVVFFVTPALAHVVRGLGIEMTPVGETTLYRGARTPYAADGEQVYRALVPARLASLNGWAWRGYWRHSDLKGLGPFGLPPGRPGRLSSADPDRVPIA